MAVKVGGVGLLAPGLANWESGRAVLSGASPYTHETIPAYDARLLPRNERRRASSITRLALHVAQEAMSAVQTSMTQELSTVFSCSGGDTETVDDICTALTLEGRPVSPNRFHNSVHNAPAGYWSIATGSRAPSTSLSAYDASFAAGMLDALSLVTVQNQPVLLVAYDLPPPKAMLSFRPLIAPFAVAMLLYPETADEGGNLLSVEITTDRIEDRMADNELEVLRRGNPAARCLPMLTAMACGQEGEVVLPYLPASQLTVQIEVCRT